jgi:hypothetical protein
LVGLASPEHFSFALQPATRVPPKSGPQREAATARGRRRRCRADGHTARASRLASVRDLVVSAFDFNPMASSGKSTHRHANIVVYKKGRKNLGLPLDNPAEISTK